MRNFVATLLCACCSAFAQGTLSGPSLGVIYDAAAQAIRPLLGIPGSSSVGKNIDTGFAITAAAISPAQDYALAVAAGGSLKLLIFNAGGASIQNVNSAATPDRMTLSPSGVSAILYYKSSASLQVITGLPGAMKVGPTVDVSTLPKTPDVLAISDDAAVLLAAVDLSSRRPVRRSAASRSGETNGEVFLVAQNGNAPRAIRRVAHASAIAFFRNSHDAVVADDVTASVTRLNDAGGASAAAWTFANASLPSPDSVQVSSDGKNILAGSSKGQVLAMMDSAGANPGFVACSCAPTEVRPLAVAAVYQVTEANSGLLWILDGNPQNPRVLFVPVPSGTTAAIGSEQQ